VLRNGAAVVGLFLGMFERNVLAFNPGWDGEARPVSDFTDIRDLQRTLRSLGVEFTAEADETTTGPAFFMLTDPDGNPVLVDQHV
jgi:lactoylglutathione lyase